MRISDWSSDVGSSDLSSPELLPSSPPSSEQAAAPTRARIRVARRNRGEGMAGDPTGPPRAVRTSRFVTYDQVLRGALAVGGADHRPQGRGEDALVHAHAPAQPAVGAGGLDVGHSHGVGAEIGRAHV